MKIDTTSWLELMEFLLNNEEEHPVAPHLSATDVDQVLDIKIDDEPIDQQDLLNGLKEIISHTPKTATSKFFNQLFGGRNSEAVLGDLLAIALNNSMYTYKVAGPMVSIEHEVLQQVCQLVGYKDDSFGTIAPGGSMCNLMACIMARDAKIHNVVTEGITQKMTLYTSEDSHYSITKNAAIIGVGINQIRKVNTDSFGRLIPSHLIELINLDISMGCIPFFINLTAGTTVLGAFDPIKEVCEIANKFNIWVHVDGAYCGGVLWSKKYRHLVEGIELSDSFSVNAHKMLGTPLTCSILVTPHKKQLYNSFDTKADYLYQTDTDDFNLGKVSLQCGRRNDALKLWTIWKARGHKGMETMVNRLFELSKFAYDYVNQNSDYTVYSYQPSLSVCFNYKNINTEYLCNALYLNSHAMVGYGSYNNDTFIRMIIVNSNLQKKDIVSFFSVIEHFE